MTFNKATFVARMKYWCLYGNLGYDQWNRWDIRIGGECDCSSLVIHDLREAGQDTGDATYTGNLSSNLTARGWVRLPNNGEPQTGDILLNDIHHVAVDVGNGCLAQASIDERGMAYGGRSGDQTNETNVKGYYNFPWTCYLRYVGSDGGGGSTAPAPSAPKPKTKTDNQLMLTIDGDPGGATYSRFEQVMGTPIDGVKSSPSAFIKKFQKFLNSVVSRKDVKAITGSERLAEDGYDGWRTWKVFQYWAANVRKDLIKAYAPSQSVWQFADGIPGVRTWKVLQHMLNESYANSGKLLKK